MYTEKDVLRVNVCGECGICIAEELHVGEICGWWEVLSLSMSKAQV